MFTSGHPGQTQRLNTVAHLEFLRDYSLPLSINTFTGFATRSTPTASRAPEQQRQANDDFFSIENSLKSWQGQIGGLKDPSLLNKKRADEKALRDRVNANADLKAKYGDAWDQVAKARAALPPYNLERVFFESGLGFFTDYFTLARTLVRWADESAEAERPAPAGILRCPQGRDRAADGVRSADSCRRRTGQARGQPGGDAADSSARTTRS